MRRVSETLVQLESYRRNMGVYSIERHSPEWGTHDTSVNIHYWVGQRQYIDHSPFDL